MSDFSLKVIPIVISLVNEVSPEFNSSVVVMHPYKLTIYKSSVRFGIDGRSLMFGPNFSSSGSLCQKLNTRLLYVLLNDMSVRIGYIISVAAVSLPSFIAVPRSAS